MKHAITTTLSPLFVNQDNQDGVQQVMDRIHAQASGRDRLASSPNEAHRHQFLPGGTKPALHSFSYLVSAAEIFDP